MAGMAEVDKTKPTICIVGGGNAAHTLAALLPHKGFPTVMFCPFENDAEVMQKGIEEQGFMLANFGAHNEVSGPIKGKPFKISKDPVDVIPQSDVVIMPLPSFAYESTLRAIAPHLKNEVYIAVTPGQGGFDWVAREVLGEELKAKRVTFFSIMPMPFNCRISSLGKQVEVQELKRRYRIGSVPSNNVEACVRLNTLMFGETEACGGSFLTSTLYPINAVIHPARLYTLCEGKENEVVDRNPLFYEELTEEGAKMMDAVNKELLQIVAKLKQEGVPVGKVPHIYDFLAVYVYADSESSSLLNFFRNNNAYKGFKCPFKELPGGGFKPDIPLGLCIYKGVADLAGVETPVMDTLIGWAQKHMGKEYIVDGALKGEHLGETNAPQRFGIDSLQKLKDLESDQRCEYH